MMFSFLIASSKQTYREKILSIIFFLLVIPSFLSEGYCQAYNVRGTVSVESVPVKYASVTFTNNNDTSKKVKTMTNESGQYQLYSTTSIDEGKVISYL